MKQRWISVGIFAAYCALMLWLLFVRGRDVWVDATQNFNPVPLETVIRFVKVLFGDYSAGQKRHAVVNLVGNVIMFVPLGFFTSLLWKAFRPLWRCALLGSGIILCVELTQFASRRGSCDFDDLLLNVVGIAIGYGLFRLVQKMRK